MRRSSEASCSIRWSRVRHLGVWLVHCCEVNLYVNLNHQIQMNARINTTTPAGKSLEGFPFDLRAENIETLCGLLGRVLFVHTASFINPSLHKGDIITIEVL